MMERDGTKRGGPTMFARPRPLLLQDRRWTQVFGFGQTAIDRSDNANHTSTQQIAYHESGRMS